LREFPTPRLVSSKCIEFEPCRYNGLIIKSSIVEKLKEYVEFHPVCPEVEIGLGIPRDPIRLEESNGELELLQPSTAVNLTVEMSQFANSFLESLENIDGFILKNKSPSCGVKAVRVYINGGKSRPKTDGVGAFAREVYRHFPYHPVEDEGRLRNFSIRENFITRIYTLADFREKVQKGDFRDLLEFHTRNKLLFLSYSQFYLRELGRMISNSRDWRINKLIRAYGHLMEEMLLKDPTPPANVNVLQHAAGHFSKDLTHQEKSFFLNSLQKYREGRIPLLINQNILKSWIIRFENEYLAEQSFFEPYPEDLMQITFI
jgi:uncharacterized protein YbgA (DUF1722 family)/uncharacterized protein YbbK (DUF523 family)